MLNRRSVWITLKREGILDSSDEKVKELVSYIRAHPQRCWADLIPVYRERFYGTFDTIVPVLVKMRDPVVNSALLRNLDPSKSNELKTLSAIADTNDSGKDPLTFKRLAKIGNRSLNKKLKTKDLPENVRSLLNQDTEEVATGTATPKRRAGAIRKSTGKVATAKAATRKAGTSRSKPTGKK